LLKELDLPELPKNEAIKP